ncbi:MAG: oligosaccharide flippase family protein [Bacteroidota bacterium]
MKQGPSLVQRLASQSGIYALANVLLKAGGLVLAILYVRYLSQEGYALYDLIETLTKFATLAGGLGIGNGLLKFLTAKVSDEQAFIGSALISSAAVGLLCAALFYVFRVEIAVWLLGVESAAPAVGWGGVFVGTKIIVAVVMMVLRIRERAVAYAAVLVLELVALLVLVGVALLVFDAGLTGILASMAGSAVFALMLCGGLAWRDLSARWAGSAFREMVRFGFPLIGASVGVFLLNLGDRYLINWILGTEAVAPYALQARLSGVLNLVLVNSFSLAFGVVGLKSLVESPEAPAFFRRAFRHYVAGGGLMVLGLAVFAKDVLTIVSGQQAYIEAYTLVLPYALGFYFYGLYYLWMTPLYAAGRSTLITGLVLGAATLNIALNLILLPVFGVMGAAVATVASYGGLAGCTFAIARRSLAVNYAWHALGLVLLLTVLLTMLTWQTMEAGLYRWAQAGSLLAYVGVVLAAGVYRLDEVHSVLDRLRRR